MSESVSWYASICHAGSCFPKLFFGLFFWADSTQNLFSFHKGLSRLNWNSPYYAIGRNIIIIPPKGLLPKYKFSVRGRNPFCMDSDFHIYIDFFRILVVNSLDNSDTFFLKRKGQPHRLSFILIRSANRLPMHPSSTLRPVVEHRGVEPLRERGTTSQLQVKQIHYYATSVA